jgi:hypothetical protein
MMIFASCLQPEKNKEIFKLKSEGTIVVLLLII